MGFWEALGSLAAKAQYFSEQVQMFESEYEMLTDSQLKEEYRRIKDRDGDEFKYRKAAMQKVLSARGYGSKNNH